MSSFGYRGDVPESVPRRYHHGDLRRAVIDAAVAEVQAIGAAAMSMREIARRAGVSHAAPAYHFGDRAGIFTAIATEGFRLITETIAPVVGGPDGFMLGGAAYVRFALEHPGHFEVMFRPDLYHGDDPDLLAAREAAFAILYDTAEAAMPSDSAADITGLVIAGWSASHGFATLWLNSNLRDKLGPDPTTFAASIAGGMVTLGEIARRQLDGEAGSG